MKQGLTHVYFGDGKGKTTAAVGLAVRSAGAQKKVLFAQFFKGRPSSEVAALALLPGMSLQAPTVSSKFVWDMSEAERAAFQEQQSEGMQTAWNTAIEGDYDLLVLDEGLDVLRYGFVDEAAFLEQLATRPDKLEVVLTGHYLSEAIKEAADYVTEMVKVKHPYDVGVKQRKGIEF